MARRSLLQDGPFARVTARGAKRLRSGHPWVFRSDVAEPAVASGGSVVRVLDDHGNSLGQAFWAQHSPVALRLLSRRHEAIERPFWQARLAQALAWRTQLYGAADGVRLVHGEADLLPGLFVDRYGDVLALQTTSEGAELHLPLFVELLVAALGPRLVVAKNDASARDFEGLPRYERTLWGTGPGRSSFHEGTNRFELDVLSDLKTGAFLDQRENHLHLPAYLPDRGTALDTFSYHGGFALALATRGSVTAVELDPKAAQRLRANAEANRRSVDVVEGNAFDVLRALEQAGRRFDVVVIDPPALAKRQGELDAALRAYKELNLRGLRLTRPGGVLCTCSCSGKLTAERFAAVLDDAMADVKRPVQLLERRGAGRDHPVLHGVPETEYLKCWIYRVL